MNRFASSPESAAPPHSTTRSDDTSYMSVIPVGRACRRWSITGTTTSVAARLAAMSASTRSGSNRLRRTIVEFNASARFAPIRPKPWKSGAAITVVSLAMTGRLASSAAPSIAFALPWRTAPLGRPVVPEVRTMIRPGFAGGSSGRRSLLSTPARTASSSRMIRGRASATAGARAVSCTSISMLSSSTTAATWGGENAALT
jgi:hypothetical protein